ncbi:MAG: S9 family peptidase [Anaerolineales bacterium]|nr:S9 family peptidase [Anaerolineales bacterium]
MNGKILDLETLLKVPYVDPYGGYDISPDGKRVAFAWKKSGEWEIYELYLDRSAPDRQISAGQGGKFAPRYSPDGGRLAYVVDIDGGEELDLCVYDFAAGKHTNLTAGEPGALQPNFSWSPDGEQLAFLSNRSGHFDTYIMPAGGGAARLVLGLPNPDWDVDWSPDGRWLAVTSEAQGQDYAIFIVPVEGGEPRRIGDQSGLINAREADWSPDSKRIAFCSNPAGEYDIGVYEVESGQVAWLTSGQGEKESPRWSPDGERLAYIHSQGEVTSLALLDLVSGASQAYQVESGVHYALRFTADGERLLFIFDNPRHPCDLWALSLAQGTFEPLTRSLPAGLEDAAFVMPEIVRYPGMDAEMIPALLFRPAETDRLPPAVVIVHGGPSWLFQVTWYPMMQYMVSRGWVVLAPNYRGSTGYGRAWQQANRYDQGGIDTRDVAAGAQYLAQAGLADPARIAVTGRSHGGYLTMTCLTQYPELWAAGSAVVPFLNWFTSHANSREDLQHWDIENMGDPEQNYDLWYERSPFFFLERVKAPVQLICGQNDPRCPASESLATRDKLLEMGKQVDFMLYKGEGHGFLKIENVVDSEVRRVEFLARPLENR